MKRREFLTSSATLVGARRIRRLRRSARRGRPTQPVKGGTLIWGHSETTQNLDIHQTGTASTVRVLQNVHDAIVTIDKNFTVIPSLAKSFEQSPDGLTYTFHLRPGVKFHDGKTMTSADVKYSFDRCRAKETGAVNFEVFNDVGVDRDARRPHRRRQDEPHQRAVPQPPRRKRRRRDHASGVGRPAGQDADRRGAVQVRATGIWTRGRARALRRLLGRAGLSRQGHRTGK